MAHDLPRVALDDSLPPRCILRGHQLEPLDNGIAAVEDPNPKIYNGVLAYTLVEAPRLPDTKLKAAWTKLGSSV